MATDLDDVRGLACDPDQRWPSMAALVAELELRARPPLRRPRAVDAGIIVIAVFGLAWPPCGTWR